MNKFTGSCQPIGTCDVKSLSAWISAIPFEDWPQQSRLEDGSIRPAMVTDRNWNGFYDKTEAIVRAQCAREFGRMLSVVMPGASIPKHTDEQTRAARVHIPLVSNASSWFIIEGIHFSMQVGMVYLVNTERSHQVINHGVSPRIHLMFDVDDML